MLYPDESYLAYSVSNPVVMAGMGVVALAVFYTAVARQTHGATVRKNKATLMQRLGGRLKRTTDPLLDDKPPPMGERASIRAELEEIEGLVGNRAQVDRMLRVAYKDQLDADEMAVVNMDNIMSKLANVN
jgi:hypothetical protein